MNTSKLDPAAPPAAAPRSRIAITILLALFLGIAAVYVAFHRRPDPGAIPKFTTNLNVVRPALPDRIVSFHRGRADKHLILLASQLGFNGVQFQIEGSNEEGIKDFAARDEKERLVDYCHSLGMKVTVWVHELADLPTFFSPNYLGPVSVDNEKIWKRIDERYEWILGTALPNIDGLVLTVVETQIKATDTDLMLKLVNLLDDKCRKYKKQLVVRTFVWHPEELESVIPVVQQMPDDVVVMSKCVPQDWQMRGGNAAEIGAFGKRPQIVEYDVAGEYFLTNNVANCMVDRLKEQFEFGISKNVQGICVRVDRYDASVIWEPNEVNLWALGLLAAGATDNTDEIWSRWATYRYGEQAAPAVIKALKPTSTVIAEMLSIGPFTYGDTRGPNIKGRPSLQIAQPDDDLFNKNWQMWRWDKTYLPILEKASVGDPAFVEQIRLQQAAARTAANQSLAELEKARPFLSDKEYQILYTKLLTNQVQFEYRSAATLAALHARQMVQAQTPAQYNAIADLYKQDIAAIQKLADTFSNYPDPATFDYLGKRWQVNAPLAISYEQLSDWITSASAVPDRYAPPAAEPPATNPDTEAAAEAATPGVNP
jgi:hypothetical protein